MPDVTVKEEKIGKYLVTMKIKTMMDYSYYTIELCYEIDDGIYGYPLNSMNYSIYAKKQANATYNRYRLKAKKLIGEV